MARQLSDAQRASAARMLAARAEALAAAAARKCPKCGAGIRFNLSLSGWIQCEQLGAIGFRKHSHLPSCDWQGFTE